MIHEDYGGREKSYSKVWDMFHYNNTLYWTNPGGLNMEIFEEGFGFYHSVLKESLEMEHSILVHPTAHPVPFPLNPVENVQVLFDTEKAVVSWNNFEESRGCQNHWNQWKYSVKIICEDDSRGVNKVPCQRVFLIPTFKL